MYRLSFLRNLNPALKSAFRRNTSGFVFVLCIFDIFRLRCSGVNLSIFFYYKAPQVEGVGENVEPAKQLSRGKGFSLQNKKNLFFCLFLFIETVIIIV